MTNIFASKLSDVVIAPQGWARLPSGMYVTKLPLLDVSQAPLAARLNMNEAYEAAEKFGGPAVGIRPITPRTVIELNAHGYRIDPVILPNEEQRSLYTREKGETPEHFEGRIRENMSSIEWCKLHDDSCWYQLREWDGESPVMNFGKFNVHLEGQEHDDWTHLFGWSKHEHASSLASNAFQDWYQPLYRHSHKGRNQRDYGTLTMLESDGPQ